MSTLDEKVAAAGEAGHQASRTLMYLEWQRRRLCRAIGWHEDMMEECAGDWEDEFLDNEFAASAEERLDYRPGDILSKEQIDDASP